MSRAWVGAALLLVLLVAPLPLNAFRVGLLTEVLIFGLLAASLDVLVGYTGLPSLGHAAYFGVGGYTVALLARSLTDSAAVGLLGGVAGAVLVAVVTGWLAVRTRGVYFLMLTLAFAQLLFALALTWPVVGGANGLSVPRFALLPGDGGRLLAQPLGFYYYVLVVVLLSYAALRTVVGSPFGRTLVGVRENEARMRALGYSVPGYKLAAYVIAGGFAGLAGALFVQHQRFISPSNVSFEISALVLIMVIMGGAGTLHGPVIGAAVVLLLRDELSSRFEHWELLLGLVFVAFVYLLPRGVAGLRRRVAA